MATDEKFTLRCTDCRTRNRIPAEKAGTPAVCGKCGGKIDTKVLLNDKPVEVSDGSFDSLVVHSPLPVLLDCWAKWCGPCKMIGPIMNQLASQWKAKARVGKLDVDQNPNVAGRFDIMTIPTLLIFDKGQLRDRLTGAVSKQQIIQTMNPYLL